MPALLGIVWLAVLLPCAHGQELVEEFSQGMERWWIEGSERTWIQDGRLRMKADNPAVKGGGAATAWWKSPQPADFVLTLEAQVIASPASANNINLFLCYSDPAGRPLIETRATRGSAG